MIDWYCHPGATHWVWTMHNVCAARGSSVGKIGEKLFDPVKIFRGGLLPTAIMSVFFLLDRAFIALGRETSVMTAIFKKPEDGCITLESGSNQRAGQITGQT